MRHTGTQLKEERELLLAHGLGTQGLRSSLLCLKLGFGAAQKTRNPRGLGQLVGTARLPGDSDPHPHSAHCAALTLVKSPCSVSLCILAESRFRVITGVSPSELTGESAVLIHLPSASTYPPATIPRARPATHSTPSPPSLNSPAGRVHGSPLAPCLCPRGRRRHKVWILRAAN